MQNGDEFDDTLFCRRCQDDRPPLHACTPSQEWTDKETLTRLHKEAVKALGAPSIDKLPIELWTILDKLLRANKILTNQVYENYS